MSVPTLPHDELEPLIAADALDGLDPADRARLQELLAEHGLGCAECRRLQSEYREVAGQMALTLAPRPVSPQAEEALLASARRPSEPAREARRDGDRARRRWPVIVAVAAALAILAGAIGYALAPRPSGLRTLTLQGQVPGQVSLVYQPGHADAVLVSAGLPDPGQGRVYELWYQRAAGAAMSPAGVFTAAGSFRVRVGRSFVVVAVTVEPGPNGSPQPTSAPILSASA